MRPSGIYTIYEGLGWEDENGGISSLKTISGLTVNDCEEACTKNSEMVYEESCVAFTFMKDGNKCNLKSARQAIKVKWGERNASYLTAITKLRPGAGWHTEKGKIRYPIKIPDVESAGLCEGPCLETSGCVGWTYVKVSYTTKTLLPYRNFRTSDLVSTKLNK